MHSSLVALLKKKYVYEDTLRELISKYDLSDKQMKEFYEVYLWDIRSFRGDDENNIRLFLQDISKYPSLSPTEEHELIVRYQHWDQSAKEKIILHMTGYVITLAKKFNWLGISLLDLVSEWLLGLERAITMYDPAKAHRLSTYAHNWIHNYILCSLAKFNGSVSLPLHTITEIKFIDSVEQKLFQTFGRPPTQDEIICAVSEASCQWRRILENRVMHLMHLKQGSVNLWHAMFKDSEDDLGSQLIDTNTLTPAEECQKEFMKTNVNHLICNIATPRDANIIRMRFGLNWPVYTLEQIWKDMWVTRERIRQIEKRFIIKVRTSPQLNMFLSL